MEVAVPGTLRPLYTDFGIGMLPCPQGCAWHSVRGPEQGPLNASWSCRLTGRGLLQLNLPDFSGLSEQIKPVSTFLGLAGSNRWSLSMLGSHFSQLFSVVTVI